MCFIKKKVNENSFHLVKRQLFLLILVSEIPLLDSKSSLLVHQHQPDGEKEMDADRKKSYHWVDFHLTFPHSACKEMLEFCFLYMIKINDNRGWKIDKKSRQLWK